jgi:hypothetical protein
MIRMDYLVKRVDSADIYIFQDSRRTEDVIYALGASTVRGCLVLLVFRVCMRGRLLGHNP